MKNSISLENIRNFLLATLSLLITIVLAGYVYSAFIEEPYIKYNPMPFPVVTQTVYPGGVATATATRCNTQKHPITYKSSRRLTRENSNQPALVLESVLITIEPGCSSVATRINVVPENTPPGFYRFSGVAMVKGLIVEHEVGWNTDVFEVIAKPPSPAPVAAVPPVVQITENNALKIEVRPVKQGTEP